MVDPAFVHRLQQARHAFAFLEEIHVVHVSVAVAIIPGMGQGCHQGQDEQCRKQGTRTGPAMAFLPIGLSEHRPQPLGQGSPLRWLAPAVRPAGLACRGWRTADLSAPFRRAQPRTLRRRAAATGAGQERRRLPPGAQRAAHAAVPCATAPGAGRSGPAGDVGAVPRRPGRDPAADPHSDLSRPDRLAHSWSAPPTRTSWPRCGPSTISAACASASARTGPTHRSCAPTAWR